MEEDESGRSEFGRKGGNERGLGMREVLEGAGVLGGHGLGVAGSGEGYNEHWEC
jgi:hypothetical protein